MIGRIAFRLLLPALVGLSCAIGLVLDAGGDAPGGGMFDGIAMLMVAVLLFVLLASLTFQALLLVRRSESLTVRALPQRIAVLQLALYAVVALWVALLVTVPLGLFGGLFIVAVIALSAVLVARIQAWRPAPSQAVDSLALPSGPRAALWAYTLLALAAMAYVIAALLVPTLDSDGLRPLILLIAFGLPLSIVALPIALVGSLIGLAPGLFALPLVAIVVNIVIAQLLLWSPRRRTQLVNRFFRLGRV